LVELRLIVKNKAFKLSMKVICWLLFRNTIHCASKYSQTCTIRQPDFRYVLFVLMD